MTKEAIEALKEKRGQLIEQLFQINWAIEYLSGGKENSITPNQQRNREIFEMYIAGGVTYADIAKKFGISRNAVSGIVYRETHKTYRIRL